MSRPKFPIFLVFTVCMMVVNSAYSAQKPRAGKKTADPAPPVQQEAPPPPPLTPEQMPAVAPQVSYQNGQLTIVARNSTLGDILRAVRARTGAEVDIPGNVTERVVGQFGPGESRDVVADLLNGSHFNYVMMASETNPNQLKTLIVTSKGSTAPENPSAGNQPPQPEPPQVQAQEQPADQGTEDFADDTADDQQVADQPVDDQQQPAPQVNISPNGQVQPNVKTPEQLLQELQQRQQQIQQQQQQPGAAPPQGAPQGFPIPPQGGGPN